MPGKNNHRSPELKGQVQDSMQGIDSGCFYLPTNNEQRKTVNSISYCVLRTAYRGYSLRRKKLIYSLAMTMAVFSFSYIFRATSTHFSILRLKGTFFAEKRQFHNKMIWIFASLVLSLRTSYPKVAGSSPSGRVLKCSNKSILSVNSNAPPEN